jgi:DNA replication and repair protein RecF
LFAVNDIRRRKKDFLAFFKAVVFRPEDLRLVEGSPSRRRSFLDSALSMVSEEYRSCLSRYEQTLKRRNRLLQKVGEGKEGRDVLNFWNLNLVKNGEVLQTHRSKFIEFIREVVFPFELNIEYEPSLISEKRLLEHLDKEIMLGHSLIGPHKDDFSLKFSQEQKGINDMSLLAYGSRGQQRLGVLWLKIAELQFLTDKIGYQPVLLLDDILSELDVHSKDMVLSLLSNYQSILTTADADVLADLRSRLPDLNLIIL